MMGTRYPPFIPVLRLRTVKLPPSVRCGDSIENLFTSIYQNFNQPQENSYFSECAILTSRNAEVKELNEQLLRVN